MQKIELDSVFFVFVRTGPKIHPFPTNETSDVKRPPRRNAAATGGLLLPAPTMLKRLSHLGTLVWADAAPKPYPGSSDGDTAIGILNEVVTCWVLVWFGRQREI